MRAQSSFEYMGIVVVVLAVLIPLTTFIYQHSETANRSQQAQIAVNSIAAAADALYSQGQDAKTTLSINLPAGFLPKESYSANGTILISYTTPFGKQSAIAHLKANITGWFSPGFGFKIITLKVISGQVNISG